MPPQDVSPAHLRLRFLRKVARVVRRCSYPRRRSPCGDAAPRFIISPSPSPTPPNPTLLDTPVRTRARARTNARIYIDAQTHAAPIPRCPLLDHLCPPAAIPLSPPPTPSEYKHPVSSLPSHVWGHVPTAPTPTRSRPPFQRPRRHSLRPSTLCLRLSTFVCRASHVRFACLPCMFTGTDYLYTAGAPVGPSLKSVVRTLGGHVRASMHTCKAPSQALRVRTLTPARHAARTSRRFKA